ncbi:translation initiation factor eIF-2B subunit family protein [Aspergillus candidus]|uniref:Nagb/rpia/CoA transferase-like protein n=1 Tax=Aspergillus candidus TaxID=41067 RepID=A0A2I2FI47_ASPCN|nr:nagb/rpia/CoA transferase-like protein [Aspergillus candidus]PLB40308.1 nagb/rpia/CoA transferase-like protein [Aspergillus candidus]
MATKKQAVVSSLIFRFPNGPTNPEVALFQRSAKVRTYQHHLAPIAGSIEPTDPDALSAAWRELAEETTLSPITLSHWRTGKPFTFRDDSVGREWTVHPFAFTLRTDATARAIHTDWEAETWRWYNAQEVLTDTTLQTVPRLRDTLRRTWFEGQLGARAGGVLACGLDRLKTDHESGAHELAAVALTVFRDVLIEMARERRDPLAEWASIRMTAWHVVKNGRESMGAATLNALLAVVADMDDVRREGPVGSSLQTWERIGAVVDFHLQRRVGHAGGVKAALGEYFQALAEEDGEKGKKETLTVLTMSASSTIRDSLLEAWAGLDVPTLELRVLESRPLFEGASLASSLMSRFKVEQPAGKTLRVRLYPDAAAAVAARGVDVVLLGADQISARKGICNKTGSLPVVLSAREVNLATHVVVLTQAEKINGCPDVVSDDAPEDNGPPEVVDAWCRADVKGLRVLEEAMVERDDRLQLDVHNVYFEWIPLHLVDAFVCEEGVLTEETLRRRTADLAALYDRLFGDL